uniref:Uncharacterized protein n=1 Tax=Chenopodium quinoa TaxID=63459 RepID=A0A803M9Z3_CHEQI
MRDIMLLENQLPFFVLEGLYNIAFGDEKLVSPHSENSESATAVDDIDNSNAIRSLPSFMELCCQVLMVGKSKILEKFDDCKVLHLVDFLRTCYLPSVLRDPIEGENDDLDFPPTVERLKDAGIKFEVAKNGSLLDIEFSNGVLRIPKLEVEDHTESLLLNLSALELCHYHFDSYIIDYIVLMDVLITTLKDVGYPRD